MLDVGSYSVGIDLGGTFTKLAAVSGTGDVLAERRVPTVAGRAPEEALRALRAACEEMADAAGLPYPPGLDCGIGIPAVVDYQSGYVKFSGPLDWRDVALGDLAREALGCPVAVDDDVAAGALADLYYGCARGASDLLYISWGTGIGAGVVLGGKLYHSRGGAMYELGHMPADPESVRRCYCGCTGCLEVEAGGRAMVEQARERLSRGEASSLAAESEITPERIAYAAEAGDALGRAILFRSAVLLARVLAGALALLNPDTVVFGGGVSNCLPLVREVFERELRLRTPSFSFASLRILQSSFADRAGVIGAATLPVERRAA